MIGRTIERIWDSCLDTAAFAAVGYLAGRAVNWFTQWSSAPAFFTTFGQIDLQSSAACCGLFILIDRIAQTVLSAVIGGYEVNKPIYSAVRIGLSATAAINLLNVFSSSAQLAKVETKPAVAVILTAIVIYSQILVYLSAFNHRHIGVDAEMARDFQPV